MGKSDITIEVNGIELSGSHEKVSEALEKLGFDVPEGYYLSETRGLLKITDMDSHHIVNAMLKRYREWVANLSDIRDEPKKVLEMIQEGPTSDKVLVSLISALIKMEGE